MQDTKGKVILSLLAGATVGAVAGLLLAPETGNETRSSLKKSASKLGDDLSKLLKDGKSRLSSLSGQATTTEQQSSDRTAADNLLSSMSATEVDTTYGSHSYDDLNSDYDGTGGDGRYSGPVH
ncbi:YtxH domain-containing protein [Hymenobacter mucosus]|uniref:YtxH-like protein n=1 Tax=Hymenobacter mucosus TaxID=1411120 RepID=A0A238YIY7_9BACT|nr:YtxH domain-containing protein [Hymenobacter mucosus]SNR71216.1 YtxH-like protein [Hymenobacter mucosus]